MGQLRVRRVIFACSKHDVCNLFDKIKAREKIVEKRFAPLDVSANSI